jgi:hypothetical protein
VHLLSQLCGHDDVEESILSRKLNVLFCYLVGGPLNNLRKM